MTNAIKVNIRAVVFKDEKILMVKENTNGNWALPNGWADIGLIPSEVAVKEVKEESGFNVKAIKLLAVTDYKYHPHPPSPFNINKMYIHCEIVGGQPLKGIETSEVRCFKDYESTVFI